MSESGSDYLVVGNMRFAVNSNIQFEGYDSFAAIEPGEEVQVEYQSEGGENLAVEIEKGAEVSGIVEAVGSNYVVVGGTRYEVNAGTEFEEGYATLSDVQTGDEIEVEYETRGNGARMALGIEKGGDDGEDDEAEDDGDS